jgi:uncharacterized repeat protein (TIGR03843 family)
MDKTLILSALRKGTFTVQGQFLNGSNYTFSGTVAYEDAEYRVVYKPVRGEQPLWDFSTGSLAHRETAAYVLSEALGWDLVPPTIYRREAPIGPGSVQLYVEHDPAHHFFNFNEEERQCLRPAALFDLIANNADRKGGHILIDPQNHIWLIDQGLCFNTDDKLRTVIWDFSGEPIPAGLLADLEHLIPELEEDQLFGKKIRKHLHEVEVKALTTRIRRLTKEGCFPQPPSSRRPYPWPPV